MKLRILLPSLVLLTIISCTNSPQEKEKEKTDPLVSDPTALSNSIVKGWNTWDNRNIMTQVLLPEQLSLHMYIKDSISNKELYYAFTGNHVRGAEKVKTLAHTPDGSYTAFRILWGDFNLTVQTVAHGDELDVLIVPETYSATNPGWIIVQALFEYDKQGEVTSSQDGFQIKTENSKLSIHPAGKFNLEGSQIKLDLQGPVGFSTRKTSIDSIQKKIAQAEELYWQKKRSYGSEFTAYDIIQNAINWNVVYDHRKNRALTPVARTWSFGWGNAEPGGYVQFCWDNFFVAYMHSIESKALAYNEVFQLTHIIDELGFVPNWVGPVDQYSNDRSQPPVGSIMIKEIYKRHPEKWFLEENFDRLLTWNRWWVENRSVGETYLAWGSTPFSKITDKRHHEQNEFKAAINESGLDNTPMYDGVPYHPEDIVFPQADVGLMGLYIADCDALAEMAHVLGRTKEASELEARANTFRKSLKTLWNEEFGLFLNKRIDTDEWNFSISPTNFYALLGKAATQAQAETMISEHFYNPHEFWGEYILPSISRNDPGYTAKEYWRGSIWAPMNFLVYLGLRNYDLPQAQSDLAEKSYKLLVKNYEANGFVLENYHAEHGNHPGHRSEFFYHWGALLGMIPLIEHGHVLPTESKIF